MEYNYYPPQAGLPPPPVGNQQQHCSQIQMMPNSAMGPHESPIPQQQQQHHMMRQTLTPGQPPPMMTQQQQQPPLSMQQQQQQQHTPPIHQQQQTPPMHQQQTPPMHQQQQHMMHQTMPPQNQTYHQLPPHPPTPLSASPIHHPGSIHSNHSSQTNLSLQQPPSRPSTGPPPPMQHVQPGLPGPPQHHHHPQQQHHHHMSGPPQGPPQMHFNGLPPGMPAHPHHQNSHGPAGPPSLQPGMPPGPPPGPPPSAGYGVTPPPSGPLPPPPHQMHHHNHPPHHHMASQPPPPQMHHQMHHNPHHAPQPPMHQMHPMHPSMDRHGSPFYPNIPQTEYRIIELNKRLQNRPRSRGPISPLPSSITDDTFWWERFACDFFDDDSTLTIRVPGEKQPTEYTIGRTLIPRFFKTYFDGGVSDFSIKLHHTEELNHPNNPSWVMLKCDHTDITTKNVYRHQSSSMPTYVVVHTEGQLTLEFCSNSMLDTLLIKSWRFHTRQCHEFIDRSMTAGGMSPYLNEPVTRHGLTKRTINYLKMCMIMEPMQDLMLHHRQTNGQTEPKACLKHLLLNRFNVKPTVEEKKQKRKRGTRAANTGATKKSKANNSMNMVKNNMNFNNNIMSPANMGGGVPNLPLASQDVMVVGEPSMLGAEFGDENERRITRLENSQFDPSTMNSNMNNNNTSNNNNNCNGGTKMINQQQQSQPNCGTPPNNSNGNHNIGQLPPQDQLPNCGTPSTPNNGIGRMTPQDPNCVLSAPHTPNNIGGHQMNSQDQQLPNNQQLQQQPPPPPAQHQHQHQLQLQQQQAPPPLQSHQQDLDLSSSQ